MIRRNTKAFKAVAGLFSECETRADREQLIRLYITKAGHGIGERISVEAMEDQADVFYNLVYTAILANLESTTHQLHLSDEIPGMYFFRRGANSTWDENPFTFDERIRSEFPELGSEVITSKREKPIKPPQLSRPRKAERPAKKTRQRPEPRPTKVKHATPRKRELPQPTYSLKHHIDFTNRDQFLYKEARITKGDVLDYYNDMAGYMLPYLKDRPIARYTRTARGATKLYRYAADLTESDRDEIPAWLKLPTIVLDDDSHEVFIANDKEHLLYLIETGAVSLHTAPAYSKTPGSTDYSVIAIEASDDSFQNVVDVAIAANLIITGLGLTSCVKTDGAAGLHLYIPLDKKSDFAASALLAENLCKLIRLKLPGQVTFKNAEDYDYTKVTLDFTLNNQHAFVIAPYSLGAEVPTVATPLHWDEVTRGLIVTQFNPATIFKRLHENGDPFASLFKKRYDPTVWNDEIQKHYGFLFA